MLYVPSLLYSMLMPCVFHVVGGVECCLQDLSEAEQQVDCFEVAHLQAVRCAIEAAIRVMMARYSSCSMRACCGTDSIICAACCLSTKGLDHSKSPATGRSTLTCTCSPSDRCHWQSLPKFADANGNASLPGKPHMLWWQDARHFAMTDGKSQSLSRGSKQQGTTGLNNPVCQSCHSLASDAAVTKRAATVVILQLPRPGFSTATADR
jgi:hypothetical protein